MANSSSNAAQRIIPYLAYADAPAAITSLCDAFGFEERFRLPMPDGRIGHAEVVFEGNVVMLASAYKELGFISPKELPAVHAQIYLRVDNLDAHYERARKSGATIATEPANEHGERSYRAVDSEGHRWIFSTPLSKSGGN